MNPGCFTAPWVSIKKEMQNLFKKNSMAVMVLTIILLLAICIVWSIWVPKPVDMVKEEPELYISATELVNLLEKEDVNAVLSPEKVVEITGVVKEINKKNKKLTVILHVEGKEHPVIICDMMDGQEEFIGKLTPNDTLVVKGIFKGF